MTLLSKNKKAYFDYEILESFEAGIHLKGYEVKSIKNKHVSFEGSYISILNNEVFIKELNIGRYQYATFKEYEPKRIRKLLLNKKEIEKMQKMLNEKGTTIIPLEVYLKKNLIKLKIGIGRGKRNIDKRQSIKNRQLDREISRKLKHY